VSATVFLCFRLVSALNDSVGGRIEFHFRKLVEECLTSLSASGFSLDIGVFVHLSGKTTSGATSFGLATRPLAVRLLNI